MSTYAIGDVQGCYASLQALLQKVAFDPAHDTLWFVGDLVNRGPDSLAVLRYVQSLGAAAITVLGNHDLHLLAAAQNPECLTSQDTLDTILAAPDCKTLLTWLQHRPLLHHDATLGYTLVHAGIHPQWSLAQAQHYAHEVEDVLRSNTSLELLQQLYGDEPACWDERLHGITRWRYLINVFTRMRFCDAQGCLNLTDKGEITATAPHLMPWFRVPHRPMAQQCIVFGHWSALQGITDDPYAIALDTGCVWGQTLTAFCLETQTRVSVVNLP